MTNKEKFSNGGCVCLPDFLKYDPGWHDILLRTSFREFRVDDPGSHEMYCLEDHILNQVIEIPVKQWAEQMFKFWGVQVSLVRATALKFKPNGYIKPHVDAGSDVTCILYLNNKWEDNWGGELRYELEDSTWETITHPTAGSVAMFLNSQDGPRHEVATLSPDSDSRIGLSMHWNRKPEGLN